MTVKSSFSKERRFCLERKFSFRQPTNASNSNSAHDSPSASIHTKNAFTTTKSANTTRRPILRMVSSASLRWTTRKPPPVDEALMAIDPTTTANAIREAKIAKMAIRELLPQSLLAASDCIAPFQKREIEFGAKLGSGEFSHVYEVKSIDTHPALPKVLNLSKIESDKRLYMQEYQKYRETKRARYAVKHIKEDYYLNHDSDSYIQAASDLALEAELLASLQHPNIIKLRGISYAGASGFADGPGGYFLVIDRLEDTLEERMRRWRTPVTRKNKKILFRRSSAGDLGDSEDREDYMAKTMDERLSIGLQISAAMMYMHKHSIIFRDLKPQNIGFDVRGDVKIFDFGLARIMPKDGNPYTDTFEMSGAGSPRYMSPEVLNNSPYNLKSDVYTFAIVLWEILSLQTPYVFIRTRPHLEDYIIYKHGRPAIDVNWPASIQGMLESSFDSDTSRRPKMKLWYKIIRETIAMVRAGNMNGLNDSEINRRRSIDSLKDFKEMIKGPKVAVEDDQWNNGFSLDDLVDRLCLPTSSTM